MKDGKFEVTDLTDTERWVCLCALLTEKGIFTTEEMDVTLAMMLDKKNKKLEEELNGNPVLKTFFNMMNK